MTGDDRSVALGAWLSDRGGRTVTVEDLAPVSAGARRFNALFTAVADGERDRLALTMIPTAAIQLLSVTDEAAVRALAEQAGVPVPHVQHVCVDESVLGGPFFVSTAIDGETVPRRVLRLVASADGDLGSTVVTQLGSALARLHTVDVEGAPAALTPESGNPPIAEALTQVDLGLSELLSPSPAFAFCARWLERHAPAEPARRAIVHSDVRNGNIIVGPDGLRAILDWEGSRVGDPAEDPAWTAQRMWRFREDHLIVGGLGSFDTLRDAYVAAGGDWDAERIRWWRVLTTVRWGLGMAGQSRSHLDGSFPSIVMAASARRMDELEFDALQLLR